MCSARDQRSLIDYIIENTNLVSQITHTRVYRERDISSGHYLVVSNMDLWARMKKTIFV